MTRPIFLHSLTLPEQSGKRKTEEEEKGEETQDAKEAAAKSSLGCLYSP